MNEQAEHLEIQKLSRAELENLRKLREDKIGDGLEHHPTWSDTDVRFDTQKRILLAISRKLQMDRFTDALLRFGKNFGVIARFLGNKTTTEVCGALQTC